MSTIPDFIKLLQVHGSNVLYHRDDSMVPCPCLTKQGDRNPEWHLAHPYRPLGVDGVKSEWVYDAVAGTLTVNFIGMTPGQMQLGANFGDVLDFNDADGAGQAQIAHVTGPAGTPGNAVLFANWDAVLGYTEEEDFNFVLGTSSRSSNPVCNAAGMIPQPGSTAEFTVKAFVQPVQAGAVRRLTGEQLQTMFGEIESDDHIGLFPVNWDGHLLNFYEWGLATEDFITYNNRKFTIVATNLIPDPADGNPWHHWEVGMRLIHA